MSHHGTTMRPSGMIARMSPRLSPAETTSRAEHARRSYYCSSAGRCLLVDQSVCIAQSDIKNRFVFDVASALAMNGPVRQHLQAQKGLELNQSGSVFGATRVPCGGCGAAGGEHHRKLDSGACRLLRMCRVRIATPSTSHSLPQACTGTACRPALGRCVHSVTALGYRGSIHSLCCVGHEHALLVHLIAPCYAQCSCSSLSRSAIASLQPSGHLHSLASCVMAWPK